MFWFLIIIGVILLLYYLNHNTGAPHATTDYKLSRMYFGEYPYVLYYLKEIVMAMNDLYNLGIVTCLSDEDVASLTERQLVHWKKFKEIFVNLVIVTCAEHHLGWRAGLDVKIVRTTICSDLEKFMQCYPNWPKSYEVARNIFFNEEIENHIAICLVSGDAMMKYVYFTGGDKSKFGNQFF